MARARTTKKKADASRTARRKGPARRSRSRAAQREASAARAPAVGRGDERGRERGEGRDQEQGEERGGGIRPFWSGTITFGLVSVPVRLYSAVRSSGVRMRMLSPGGLPLRRRYVCPKEDRDVENDELVRGYELGEGKYVALTDEELETVEPRKSRDIDLRRFVDADEIDPFLFQRAYVLTPGGETEKPYRLLADVMEREGKAGVATFVMRDKEYLVAIFANGGVLQAETLRFAPEVRSPADVGLPEPETPPAKLRTTFERAIAKLKKSAIARKELEDERLAGLRKLVEAKRKRGEDVVEAPAAATEAAAADEEEEEAPAVDLLEAIRRSMRGEPEEAARPARSRSRAAPARRRASAASDKKPGRSRATARNERAAGAKKRAS